MNYKLIKSSKGTRYMKDGKFIKITDIPEDVLQRLHDKQEVDTSRDCIFCGAPGTKQRMAYPRLVDLCDEHYYSKNISNVIVRAKEIYG